MIMPFDDFLELKWLFPSRRRKITYEDLGPLYLERGKCIYVDTVRPWTHTSCGCTGYVFSRMRRGTAYCECGDQWIVHRFKTPNKEE